MKVFAMLYVTNRLFLTLIFIFRGQSLMYIVNMLEILFKNLVEICCQDYLLGQKCMMHYNQQAMDLEKQ